MPEVIKRVASSPPPSTRQKPSLANNKVWTRQLVNYWHRCFAREVANLHHGSVMVQNRKDSQGAEAVLTLAAAEPSR